VARRSGLIRTGRGRSSGVSRDWGDGPGGTASIGLTSSAVSLLGSAITATTGEVTSLRIRGLFDVFLEGIPTADGDGYFGAVGIGKATLAAFTAGIASVPTPITEQNWDGWMWHSHFSVHVGDVTFGPGDSASQRIVIDAKAMRKFDSQEVIFAAVEVVEVGTATVRMFLDSRMLVQDSGR